jgi:integrase
MTPAMASSADLLPDRDDRPVLAAAPLRPGFDRRDLSRYDDPSWDLGPAVFRENARRCHVTVHFGSITDPTITEAMRAYLYARLNIGLPGYRPRLPPTSVRQAFNRARRFFEFVRTELGACDIARIDQRLLDRYAKALCSSRLRPIIAAQLLEIVFDLYAYRDHLGHARLRFEPWPGRSPSLVAGYRFTHGENRTPRIPEQIITPLLAWSLRYVSIFAPDIFAARAELASLEANRDALLAEDAALSFQQRRALQRDRLAAFFDERRRAGRGVPIWTTAHNGVVRRDPATGAVTPPINTHLLHLHAGIDVRAEPRMHLQLSTGAPDLIAAAVTELGLEIGGMDTPISINPATEQPWRPRFDVKTLLHEERMLQAAAYIVCAYLTGMRDCEVQAMRPGCLSLTRSEDGVIDRYRVRSVAYKSRSNRGEPAEWVTIAPVGEAVAVLERLSARSAQARGITTLWPVLSLKTGTKAHVSAEIVRQLNVYRDHLNKLFGTESEPAVPPGPSGAPWRLTTRQFRRTIAWHIANRPFGTIAGMLQYKHASVAAFEGYAGSSRSGFCAEIKAQRALGQIDDILEYFDDRRAGGSPSGPAGPRIARELDAAAEALGPLPAMIADRTRLRTLLASLARTLHVGVLADCFFDPSTALCLKRTTAAEPQAPLTALCEPTRCPNACITERHRPAWVRAAAEAALLLREKRLPEPQRVALRRDLDRIEAVIDGITTPADADPPSRSR